MTQTKMQALYLESFDVKAFTPVMLDVPSPAPGEVLVKIHASGVNPIDYKIRSGRAPYAMPELPAVLGTDMAGEVVSVGDGVHDFKPGDAVYGLTGGVRGLQGSLAEYAAVDARLIAHQPSNLDMRESAALPLVFLTAWEGLVDYAGVKSADKVLVQGGAGGVGHMAIQLAKALGAEVYATCSAKDIPLVESMGATAIDYRSATTQEIMEKYTGGQGFDVIYDTVGGPVLQSSLSAVRYYGHIASCAAFSEINLADSSLRCVTVSGVFVLLPMLTGVNRSHHGEVLQELTRLAEEGKIKPVLDPRRFSLNTALDAHDAVEHGADIKVVIDIICI